MLTNPPLSIKIPNKLLTDPELRHFFQQNLNILNQLWNRTGGGNDDIKQANDVNDTQNDRLDLTELASSLNAEDIDTIETNLDSLQDLEQTTRRLLAQINAIFIRLEDIEGEL